MPRFWGVPLGERSNPFRKIDDQLKTESGLLPPNLTAKSMAGHSHWAQIKHKKAALDAKRGQLISKLIRAITIAAREGSNPETNPKLRSAIERAKEFQVPLENIERAIKKSEGEEKLEEIIYEVYLDEVQVLIRAITDNKNRTLGEIKHLLNNFGGRLAEPGSVRWNFQERGVVVISKKDENKILEFSDLIQDFEEKNGDILLITEVKKINDLKSKLEEKNVEIKETYFELRPINTLKNLEKNKIERLNKFIEEALNLDDVEEVFTNL